jgi:Spy/CpxP family protein refolding chaperone
MNKGDRMDRHGNREGMGPGHGCGKGMIGLNFLVNLNLTPEQKAKAVDILKAHKTEITQNKDRMIKAREDLAAVIHGENPVEQNIRQAYKPVASAEEEMFVLRGKLMNEIRQILTPQQQKDMDTRRAQHIEKMKQRSDECLDNFEQLLEQMNL